jgi:hypothetical protein
MMREERMPTVVSRFERCQRAQVIKLFFPTHLFPEQHCISRGRRSSDYKKRKVGCNEEPELAYFGFGSNDVHGDLVPCPFVLDV